MVITKLDYLLRAANGERAALAVAAVWQTTPEGGNFWHDIIRDSRPNVINQSVRSRLRQMAEEIATCTHVVAASGLNVVEFSTYANSLPGYWYCFPDMTRFYFSEAHTAVQFKLRFG